MDLHGLFRMPWNIEVKLTSQAGYQSQGNNVAAGNSYEYMKIDTLFGTNTFTISYLMICNRFV